jgi:hypothetical protein
MSSPKPSASDLLHQLGNELARIHGLAQQQLTSPSPSALTGDLNTICQGTIKVQRLLMALTRELPSQPHKALRKPRKLP